MIKDIIKYPAPLSLKYATDVRVFDKELFSLIDDLKDTIKENNLDGLSAFEIGNYYNVIVIKQDDDFLEMINPRMIAHSGKITTSEKTAYYGDISAEITRYENITVVYQDRDGNDKSYKTSGKEAVVIQRKIDYTFGATFIQKMSSAEREKFEQKLELGIDVGIDGYCPTVFKRDYIVKGINILLIVMLLPILFSFFLQEKEMIKEIWQYQLYSTYFVVFLNIFYFIFAQYEAKNYKSCSSCQIGNIIGTVVISFIKLSLIVLVSYFTLN